AQARSQESADIRKKVTRRNQQRFVLHLRRGSKEDLQNRSHKQDLHHPIHPTKLFRNGIRCRQFEVYFRGLDEPRAFQDVVERDLGQNGGDLASHLGQVKVHNYEQQALIDHFHRINPCIEEIGEFFEKCFEIDEQECSERSHKLDVEVD